MKGFTLIEILVVSLIVGIIGLGCVFAVSNSQRIANEYTKQAFICSNTMLLMNNIARDVRQGAVLNSDIDKLIITKVNGENIEWLFNGDKIYRNNKEYLIVSTGNYLINGNFSSELTSKYYSVTVNLNLGLNDGKETLRKNMRNTFYCRIDSKGIVEN